MPMRTSPRRTGWLAALLLVGTFATGVLVGLLLGRTWRVPPPMGVPPFARGAPPFGPDSGKPGRLLDPVAHARELHRVIGQRLGRELDLSPAQQRAVDSVLAEQAEVLGAIQRDMQPRMHAFLQTTRSKIDSLLTPGQRERFQRLGPPGP